VGIREVSNFEQLRSLLNLAKLEAPRSSSFGFQVRRRSSFGVEKETHPGGASRTKPIDPILAFLSLQKGKRIPRTVPKGAVVNGPLDGNTSR
jgi:hypothetical protein